MAWVLTLCVGLASGDVRAQRPGQDVEDPSLETLRRERQIREGMREDGGGGVLAPGRAVEYQEVLRNPGDVALNFAWAQTQVARGDIKGAANTLERILLIAPDQAPIRLLYAIVLYRLERLDEASLELALLRGLPMEPSLRAEIERYELEISLARKQTRYTATLSMGVQYDWNRNASPYSGEASFFDFKLPVAPGDRRQSDWQMQSVGRIEMEHRLAGQDNHRLTLAANYVRGEQARLDQYDFQVGGVELGGAIDFAPTWLVPNTYARRMRLDNQRYGRIEGLSVRLEQHFTGRFQLYGFGVLENQTYYNISSNLTARESSGVQTGFGAGIAWIITPNHRVTVEAGNIWKTAREPYNAYRGPIGTITHTWLLGHGMFLATSLDGEINFYDEPEVVVSERTRRDRIGRLRTTFGVPVAFFINDEVLAQSPLFRDLTIYAGAEGQRNRSNITGNSYDNYRFSFGLTKRWEF